MNYASEGKKKNECILTVSCLVLSVFPQCWFFPLVFPWKALQRGLPHIK